MKKVYTTAMGKQIDLDALRIANEETIAVGNMKVNGRGDELGPGGVIKSTRAELMEEHYRLEQSRIRGAENKEASLQRQASAGAVSTRSRRRSVNTIQETTMETTMSEENTATPEPAAPRPEEDFETDTTNNSASGSVSPVKVRGSLADSIAKEITVNQELIKPAGKKTGPSRI